MARNKTPSLGQWLSRKEEALSHAFVAVVVLVSALAILGFYFLVVSPYGGQWKGIFRDAVFPDGFSIRGIDISHHQGRINWDKLRHAQIGNEPISFVFIKATEGSTMVDKQFDRNFKKAREAGLIRGAYHYFIPSTSARAQAHHFLSHVDLEPGDLMPVLDIETSGNLSSEALRDSARLWLNIIEKAYGAKPILYTYHKFKEKYLNTADFDAYPYWIAHYYVDSLRYGGNWKFWQHTDRGRLPGIRGDVDIDCYNGSLYDLKQLCLPEGDD